MTTVQPLPKAKFVTNFFHRNQFFEWTHFSHVRRKWVELWFVGFERNWIFSFMRSTEKREELHRKRSWKMTSQELFDVRNTDFLPIWTSTFRWCTGPRRDDSGESDMWTTFLRCEQLNRHRIAWTCHKSTATASDSKEGGEGKTSGKKNVCPSSLSDLLLEKTPGTKMAQPWNFAGNSLDIYLLPWPKKKILHRTQRKIPSAKTFIPFLGDFSTWNASIGDVYHFLVSLIVVRHLFQCKATSETHQKWIHKGIKKILCKNLVAWHSDKKNPKKATSKISFELKITHMIVW